MYFTNKIKYGIIRFFCIYILNYCTYKSIIQAKGRDIMSNADALIGTGLRVSLSIAENAVIQEDTKTFRNNNTKYFLFSSGFY